LQNDILRYHLAIQYILKYQQSLVITKHCKTIINASDFFIRKLLVPLELGAAIKSLTSMVQHCSTNRFDRLFAIVIPINVISR